VFVDLFDTITLRDHDIGSLVSFYCLSASCTYDCRFKVSLVENLDQIDFILQSAANFHEFAIR
jgi:hypothetical protein